MTNPYNILDAEERGRGKEPAHGTVMSRLGWEVYWSLDPPRWVKQGPTGFNRYCNFSEELWYILMQMIGAVVTGRLREYLGILMGLRRGDWGDW